MREEVIHHFVFYDVSVAGTACVWSLYFAIVIPIAGQNPFNKKGLGLIDSN